MLRAFWKFLTAPRCLTCRSRATDGKLFCSPECENEQAEWQALGF